LPILAVPLVFDIRQQSILMVVVFPAPFGPRKPKTSPSLTCSVRFSTAVRLPNFLVRFSVSINLTLPDCYADVNYRLVGAIEYLSVNLRRGMSSRHSLSYCFTV
jgi:hypothetical protein